MSQLPPNQHPPGGYAPGWGQPPQPPQPPAMPPGEPGWGPPGPQGPPPGWGGHPGGGAPPGTPRPSGNRNLVILLVVLVLGLGIGGFFVLQGNDDSKDEAGPADGGGLRDALTATYDPLARERLLRGCGLLSRGRVVITDRLHGHVLCLLLGIPHVLLENNYGKVRWFSETWTRDCSLACWADSPPEALALAEAMLARLGAG